MGSGAASPLLRAGGAYVRFVRDVAHGRDVGEQINYFVVSRIYVKWYTGVVKHRRKVNAAWCPGAQVRYSEHLEGMHSPKKDNGTGVKYYLWAKRPSCPELPATRISARVQQARPQTQPRNLASPHHLDTADPSTNTLTWARAQRQWGVLVDQEELATA